MILNDTGIVRIDFGIISVKSHDLISRSDEVCFLKETILREDWAGAVGGTTRIHCQAGDINRKVDAHRNLGF